MELVADLTLVLLAAVAGGFLAQRPGQPLIVGYIVAGIVIGPFAAGPTVGNVREIEQLAPHPCKGRSPLAENPDMFGRMRSTCTALALVLIAFLPFAPVHAQGAPPASPEDVVRRLYAAFNTRNAEALVSHVAADVRWMTVSGETVSVEAAGRDTLKASMTRYFRSTPTVRSQIESLMAAGDFVTVHERVRWGEGATEKTQSAVAVYRVRDAQILSVWYFDVMR